MKDIPISAIIVSILLILSIIIYLRWKKREVEL